MALFERGVALVRTSLGNLGIPHTCFIRRGYKLVEVSQERCDDLIESR